MVIIEGLLMEGPRLVEGSWPWLRGRCLLNENCWSQSGGFGSILQARGPLVRVAPSEPDPSKFAGPRQKQKEPDPPPFPKSTFLVVVVAGRRKAEDSLASVCFG